MKCAVCEHCGLNYQPKAANRMTFCSRQCAYAAKREAAAKCPMCGLTRNQHATHGFCPTPKGLVCRNCGNSFVARSNRKCCSQKCYKAEASRRSCNREHARLLARPPALKICANCGESFSRVLHPNSLYCSARCLKRAAKNNRMHYEREATLHPQHRPVYRARIFKRDNYVCQICGGVIDFSLPPGDPMSGTIDHVIPLSKGGWHAPDNVQSAHMRCNSIKGAN